MNRGMPSAFSRHPSRAEAEDVTEIELLLPTAQVADLDGAARAKGCTIGQLIRFILQDSLDAGVHWKSHRLMGPLS